MRFRFTRPKFQDLDKLIAAKDYDGALEAVAEELKKNPEKFNLLLRQAEVLGLAGDQQNAIKVYRRLAQGYAKDGFYAKAMALYKKVLKLDPSLDDVHQELADLIEEDRLTKRPAQERLSQLKPAAPVSAAPTEQEQRLKELKASKLFASFKDDVRADILTSTALRSYNEGDIIVTEGEQGSSLFLIVSGSVKVFTKGDRGEHIYLAELGPGDFFGEVSVLTGMPRTATITAKSTVHAMELTKQDIDRIAEEHEQVRAVLEEFYNQRAQDTVEAVIRRMRGED